MRDARGPRLVLDRFSGLALLGIFILVFGLWEPQTFLAMATLHTIAAEQLAVAIIALAVTVSLSAGAFDLSSGSGRRSIGNYGRRSADDLSLVVTGGYRHATESP